jgi:hypothetical protein
VEHLLASLAPEIYERFVAAFRMAEQAGTRASIGEAFVECVQHSAVIIRVVAI